MFKMACDSWQTMSWIVLLLLTLLLLVDVCTSRQLPAVHWNSTNPMFKTSNNDHMIEVMMGDLLDFTCPYYSTATDLVYQEHYIIYQVSRQEYENCNFYADSTSIMIVNCSRPRKAHRYTLYFEDFTAVPNAPEFKSGQTYYYITTSTGYKDGLMNTDAEKGACHTRNMRLSIKVCCDTTTSPTSALPTRSSGGASIVPPTSSAPSSLGPYRPSILAAGEGQSNRATTTTTLPPVRPTRRQHHSTPRWRSSTKATRKPGGSEIWPTLKPSGKPSDKDWIKDENDTDNPQAGGQGGSNRGPHLSAFSLLTVLCSWVLTPMLTILLLRTR